MCARYSASIMAHERRQVYGGAGNELPEQLAQHAGGGRPRRSLRIGLPLTAAAASRRLGGGTGPWSCRLADTEPAIGGARVLVVRDDLVPVAVAGDVIERREAVVGLLQAAASKKTMWM